MIDKTKAIINANLPRIRDPLYREIYSNVSLTMLGAFDVTLVLQKQSEISPGQPAILDQIAVVFSPQHFKGLVRSLNETLTAYEAVFGALTIPDTETTPPNNALDIERAIRSAREQILRDLSSGELRLLSNCTPNLERRKNGPKPRCSSIASPRSGAFVPGKRIRRTARNETAIKPLKTNDSARWLIRRS
jgi:Protein of unknown function (DUF3467)